MAMPDTEHQDQVHTEDNINIIEYPERSDIRDIGDGTLTLGDMHGNTMKLLWILIKEGVIRMDKGVFDEMWKAYNDMEFRGWDIFKFPVKITDEAREGLANFSTNLANNVVVANPNAHIRLLGDVFADRGMNDYLTLKVIEKLHSANVTPEFTFSDHDGFLLSNYNRPIVVETENPHSWAEEDGSGKSWHFLNSYSQANSLAALFTYIRQGLVEQGEVQNIINRCIIPNMNLISYSLSEDGNNIDLFMHAPNNFDDIKKLAIKSGIVGEGYNPKNASDLAKTIDELNAWFQRLCKKEIKEIDSEHVLDISANGTDEFSYNEATDKEGIGMCISNFIWNRLGDGNIDFSTYPDFVSHVFHGHTGVSKNNPKQIDLDNDLGKNRWRGPVGAFLGDRNNEGTYLSHCAPEGPALEAGMKLS